MEKLLAERLRETYSDFQPEYEILPQETLENNFFVPPGGELAAVDLSGGMRSRQHRDRIRDAVITKAKDFVTNHGISNKLINHAMNTAKTFFDLPTPVLRNECERCGFYSSSVVHQLQINREAKYWRDTLPIYLSSTTPLWPNNPAGFRNAVEPLASALAELAEKLICLISEGLGLDESYFANKGLSLVRRLNVNKYPRCPNPRLACGLAKHCDPDLLTITLVEAGNGAHGLEVCINNEWKRVVPRENALIVTLGSQMRVVSNQILQAPLHRVVVNSQWERTSICYAVAPGLNFDVEPADALTRTQPARYRKFRYEEYLLKHLNNYRDTSGVLPSYEIRTWL